MKKILITGANSYVGTNMENWLLRQNTIEQKYCVETLDMLDVNWKQKDFSEYDVVFHVAGIAHSDNGKISEEKAKLYYMVNTDLTIEVAKKAKTENVKQFIFMSSAIVYGESAPVGKGKIITRKTPVSPANCYGDSKVQAENGILPLNDESFRVVILRPPMIYGKGSKGNYSMLVKIANKLPFFPYVRNQRSMLYIENLTEFVRLMIDNEEQGIFWPQNKEYSNTSEMVQMIANAHDKRCVLVPGFSWMLRKMGCVFGVVNKAFGNLCYEMSMSEYKQEYRIVNLKDSIKRTEQ